MSLVSLELARELKKEGFPQHEEVSRQLRDGHKEHLYIPTVEEYELWREKHPKN